MSNVESDFSRSETYEQFIRLARNCKRGIHGAHSEHMLFLIYAERQQALGRYVQSENAVEEVKAHMTSASHELMRRLQSDEENDFILSLARQIIFSSTSEELVGICKKGIQFLNSRRGSFVRKILTWCFVGLPLLRYFKFNGTLKCITSNLL